jgi:hypothetical protein
MRSNRLAGHALPNEGRLYEYENGIYPVQEGVATCSCGEKSDSLPSANARQKWHRDHKNDVRSEMGLAQMEEGHP